MDLNISWIWGIIGIILLSLELLFGITVFYFLIFSISCFIMGFLLYLAPNVNFNLQVIIFTLVSILIILIGKKYKKTNKKSNVGQSKEHVGTIGIITETIEINKIGEISFTIGVMGSKNWQAISDELIEKNEKAVIVSIEGNYLKVKKFKE